MAKAMKAMKAAPKNKATAGKVRATAGKAKAKARKAMRQVPPTVQQDCKVMKAAVTRKVMKQKKVLMTPKANPFPMPKAILKVQLMRKPAAAGPAADHALKDHEREDQMAKTMEEAQGLAHIEVSQYDRKRFRDMMRTAVDARQNGGMNMDVPDEVLDEYEQLLERKGAMGQQAAVSLLRKAWKADPSWGHASVKDKISKRQSKTVRDVKKAMIWPRMAQKLGGDERALKALRDGDIYSITDMNNPGKKLYIMREYIDERAWKTARDKSGEQALAACMDDSNRESCERAIGMMFDLHDAMPDLMDFIDETPHIPQVVVQAQAHVPGAVMVHPALSAARQPESAWGPSTQGAVTRFLSFTSNVQTKLHAAMGKNMNEQQKKFLSDFMSDDLKLLMDFTTKYNHLLSHHGFQGKECTTTINEIKAAMKADMPEVCTVDAHVKTLEKMGDGA